MGEALATQGSEGALGDDENILYFDDISGYITERLSEFIELYHEMCEYYCM